MKKIIRIWSVFIFVLLAVSCSFDPSWKRINEKGSVTISFSNFNYASAKSNSRAIVQGNAFLYILGLIKNTNKAQLFGPYPITPSGNTVTSIQISTIPQETYENFIILYAGSAISETILAEDEFSVSVYDAITKPLLIKEFEKKFNNLDYIWQIEDSFLAEYLYSRSLSFANISNLTIGSGQTQLSATLIPFVPYPISLDSVLTSWNLSFDPEDPNSPSEYGVEGEPYVLSLDESQNKQKGFFQIKTQDLLSSLGFEYPDFNITKGNAQVTSGLQRTYMPSEYMSFNPQNIQARLIFRPLNQNEAVINQLALYKKNGSLYDVALVDSTSITNEFPLEVSIPLSLIDPYVYVDFNSDILMSVEVFGETDTTSGEPTNPSNNTYLYVSNLGGGDGSSKTSPTSLYFALENLEDGQSIVLTEDIAVENQIAILENRIVSIMSLGEKYRLYPKDLQQNSMISIQDGNLNLENLYIGPITKNGVGGGPLVQLFDNASLYASSVIFENNTTGAGTYGSAITSGAADSISINLSDSQIINNEAEDGAAIYLAKPQRASAITLDNTFISNNAAQNRGGALYVEGYENVPIFVTIRGNSNSNENTANEGSAFYINGSSVNLVLEDSVSISKNKLGSYSNSGAIHLENGASIDGNLLTVTNNSNLENNNNANFYPPFMFVSVDGEDNNPGTIEEPTTLYNALNSVDQYSSIGIALLSDIKVPENTLVIYAFNIVIQSAHRNARYKIYPSENFGPNALFEIWTDTSATFKNVALGREVFEPSIENGSLLRFYYPYAGLQSANINLSLIDSVLENNNNPSGYGGAIEGTNLENVHVKILNSSIQKNKSKSAAIFLTGQNSSLYVDSNSKIVNNDAPDQIKLEGVSLLD